METDFFIGTDAIIDLELTYFEKFLLMKLQALSIQSGYAFCSNKYLADKFKKHEMTISKSISKMEKLGIIKCHYDNKSYRKIEIIFNKGVSQNAYGGKPKRLGGVSQNAYHKVKEENKRINNNNTSLSTKKVHRPKPSQKQVILATDLGIENIETYDIKSISDEIKKRVAERDNSKFIEPVYEQEQYQPADAEKLKKLLGEWWTFMKR